MKVTLFPFPTPTLRPREDTSLDQTDSQGNLVCPTLAPKCPLCPHGQECYQQARTPTSCAKYVCMPKEDTSLSSKPVGAIVGGVIGGVAGLVLLTLMYYFFVYRRKHPRIADDVAMSEAGSDEKLGEKAFRPGARRAGLSNSVTKNHRLLAYESFMRPQARYGKRASTRPATSAHPNPTPNLGPYTNVDPVKRSSMATTISTTNASNILPVAYIPGVTIRPTKNNTRSLFLYESDLIFSDMNAIENASIVAERNQKSTTTAIRAKPRLVNVARIDEDDEDDDREEKDVQGSDRDDSWFTPQDLTMGVGLYNVKMTADGESDTDSDVDSDIVEIGRATSMRRQMAPVEPLNNVEGDQESGSFILNIGGPDMSTLQR